MEIPDDLETSKFINQRLLNLEKVYHVRVSYKCVIYLLHVGYSSTAQAANSSEHGS